MRVAVIGGTGNLGTNTLRSLAEDPEITQLVGIARRRPRLEIGRTQWVAADITKSDLVPLLRGMDAVVHLAWIFQPTHDPYKTWQTNVLGSARVFRAVAEAGVPSLVYSSSVGAYSPGPKDRFVDEDWPTHGWPMAAYSREKSYVERMLDAFEARYPQCRVVRMRPGFVFERRTATEQRRLFAGPLVPGRLVRPGIVPVVPDIPGLKMQMLHSSDVGRAFHQAVVRPAYGAFNLAAEPVIGADELAELFNARKVKVPARAVRTLLAAAWGLRLVPASPHLFDLALRLPLMDAGRAREELRWTPEHSSVHALSEFLAGLRAGADEDTPALSKSSSGPLRVREFRSGVGGTS
ncbi:NAD-dependent epimerase/dehydratase family protein [Actinocorallia aurantiaca]|jgi:nucleoside-diphosphate-sugar epimerase|uniref:NAD-dependent epimerase/dehydratase family protein n=1 Tax=Actinocorallia aurantiaca TaxID=46204 RepID=A0ABN3UMV0_9ACTN